MPSNTYRCSDGKYVVIGANGDSIFKRMMRAIGRPDLADDPGLASNDGRVERTEELDRVIGDWAARHDLDEVLEVLASARGAVRARSTRSPTSRPTPTTRRAA